MTQGCSDLLQGQAERWEVSSYQLFAEKERDAGFAADSPIDKILHMLKLTIENHNAL
jgi:hypothetical protein